MRPSPCRGRSCCWRDAGLTTTLLAALLPALQAADEQPADAVRRAPQTIRPFYAALQDYAVLTLIAAAVGVILLRPYVRSLSLSIVFPVCLMAAALLSMRRLSGFIGWGLLPLLRPFLGLPGRLAADNLIRSPGRTGRSSAPSPPPAPWSCKRPASPRAPKVALNDWLDNNIAADLFVTAGSGISKAGFSLPMDASVGDELARPRLRRSVAGLTGSSFGPGPLLGASALVAGLPPVRGRGGRPARSLSLLHVPRPVRLFDRRRFPDVARRGPRPGLGGALHMFDEDKRPTDPHRPRCVVSENFAALYHVAVGGHITIPGRTAPTIDLEIIGTVVDYSYNRGTVLVDYAWYSEEFADHQADVFDVYLKPGVDARQVQAELTKPGGWAGKQAVFVERRDELREAVSGQLERIYHLAYAQEFVVGLVALLGVVQARRSFRCCNGAASWGCCAPSALRRGRSSGRCWPKPR